MRNVTVLLLLAVLLAACGGSSPSGPTFGDGEGTVVMTATLPDQPEVGAASLSNTSEPTLVRFRVAHENHDYNLLRDATVDEDGKAVLSVPVPVGGGFKVSAAPLLGKPANNPREAYITSAATISNVLVEDETVTEVELKTQPFEYELTAPSRVRAGEPIELEIELSDLPVETDGFACFHFSTERPQGDEIEGSLQCPILEEGNKATYSMYAPDSPDGETKLYYRVYLMADPGRWKTLTGDLQNLWIPLPSVALGQEIPHIQIDAP